MRLFIFNPETQYTIQALSAASRVTRDQAMKEVRILESANFIKKIKNPKARANSYELDPKFPLIDPLRSLLIDSELIKTKDIADKFGKVGAVKLLILSGVFTKDEARMVDVFMVGDKIDKNKFVKALTVLESEIGKELRYCLFTPEEYTYRVNMHDSLVLDILSHSHQKIIDKMPVRGKSK